MPPPKKSPIKKKAKKKEDSAVVMHKEVLANIPTSDNVFLSYDPRLMGAPQSKTVVLYDIAGIKKLRVYPLEKLSHETIPQTLTYYWKGSEKETYNPHNSEFVGLYRNVVAEADGSLRLCEPIIPGVTPMPITSPSADDPVGGDATLGEMIAPPPYPSGMMYENTVLKIGDQTAYMEGSFCHIAFLMRILIEDGVDGINQNLARIRYDHTNQHMEGQQIDPKVQNKLDKHFSYFDTAGQHDDNFGEEVVCYVF